MKQFIVDIQLPSTLSEKFIEKIPAQHEQIERMMESGEIRSYSVTSDRSRLCLVFNANDNESVEQLLQDFKLYEYFKPTVTELFLYKEAPEQFPVISLN